MTPDAIREVREERLEATRLAREDRKRELK